ncbi:MAG: serine/threonine protein kinase [Bacteroidales bacterium]|nr:serine/threonine protein kinase [Bacteroidales bacterium]
MKFTGQHSYILNEQDLLSQKVKSKLSWAYKAFDEDLGRFVVLQELNPKHHKNPNTLEQFKKEAKFPFSGEYLQKIYELFEDRGRWFIALEYVEGIDLKQFLLQNKNYFRQYPEDARSFFIQTLNGLKHMHEAGYVHCDIKPSNLIVSKREDQKIKATIIDYGQSRKIQQADYINDFPCSLLYSSPEQVLNAKSLIDASSDLYSLGICLYETLSGQFPFKSENPLKLMILQLNTELHAHKNIPDEWFRIILKATQKQIFPKPPKYYPKPKRLVLLKEGQANRFTSAEEMIQAILQVKIDK